MLHSMPHPCPMHADTPAAPSEDARIPMAALALAVLVLEAGQLVLDERQHRRRRALRLRRSPLQELDKALARLVGERTHRLLALLELRLERLDLHTWHGHSGEHGREQGR
eukprot:7386414-Prymnesium_polylepis.1